MISYVNSNQIIPALTPHSTPKIHVKSHKSTHNSHCVTLPNFWHFSIHFSWCNSTKPPRNETRSGRLSPLAVVTAADKMSELSGDANEMRIHQRAQHPCYSSHTSLSLWWCTHAYIMRRGRGQRGVYAYHNIITSCYRHVRSQDMYMATFTGHSVLCN